jgi:hypothetical protein
MIVIFTHEAVCEQLWIDIAQGRLNHLVIFKIILLASIETFHTILLYLHPSGTQADAFRYSYPVQHTAGSIKTLSLYFSTNRTGKI